MISKFRPLTNFARRRVAVFASPRVRLCLANSGNWANSRSIQISPFSSYAATWNNDTRISFGLHEAQRYYSSTISLLDDVASTSTIGSFESHPGDELYKQAVGKMQFAKEIQKSKEEEKNQKMFEAWKQAQESEKSPKSQGVKVVQTLVKEVRKEQKLKEKEADDEAETLQEASRLLERASQEHEHPLALVQLGELAMERAKSADLEDDRDGQAREVTSAINFFERGGKAGSHLGWFQLGQLYFTGYPAIESDELDGVEDVDLDALNLIVKPNMHNAMDAFVHAIDLGDQDAMYLVGIHRITSGGRENLHSGLNLVKRAAKLGNGSALYYLSLLNLNGEPLMGIEPCSETEFMELLDKACEVGNPDALFTRGHSYYHGTEGYPEQPARGLDDFLKAADGGHADAAVSAGAVLFHGAGVPEDKRKAFELYQAAGEMGSIEGWRNVVACYVRGEGVPQSIETAKYIASVMLHDKDEEAGATIADAENTTNQ